MAQLDSSIVYGNLKVNRDLTVLGNLMINSSGSVLSISSGVLKFNGNTIWHAANDGSGSGLDADLLEGYHSATAATGNTIVQRDGNGDITGRYINSTFLYSSRVDENSTASSYIYDSGDGYLRKKTLANTKTELVTSASVIAGLGYTPFNKAGDTASGTITSTNVMAFISKASGNKSWIMHHPNYDSLIFAPSATADGVDWDWTKQVVINNDGTMTIAGNNVYHAGNLTPSDYILKAGSSGIGALTFTKAIVMGADANGCIELGDSTAASSTPFIDFHFGVSGSQDYNIRVINSTNNSLNVINAAADNNALKVNGNIVWHAGNFDLATKRTVNTGKWQLSYSNITLATATTVPTIQDFAVGTKDSGFTLVSDTNNFSSVLKVADYYIAKFTTTAYCSISKTITLTTVDADDTFAIYVNGTLVASGIGAESPSFTLAAGYSTIDLLFYEHTGGQTFGWTGSAIGAQVDYIFCDDMFSNGASSLRWGDISGKPSSFTPASHASTATTYGVADATNYGHVKIGTGIGVSSGTISVSYGTTSNTACVGNDSRLSDNRTPTAHGDSAHNNFAAIRITFPTGKSTYTWTHNKNWTDYIVQVTPNSPETHFYYSSKTANAVTINLDDEAYEEIQVDVMIISLSSIATATATV